MRTLATTIEQSKHLLELGLDPKTADMWWSNRFVYWQSTPMIGIATEQNQLYTFKWSDDDIPAWSLSALLEVIPAMIVYPTWADKRTTDVWFTLDKDYNNETKKQFYMCYYKSLDTHQLATNTDPSHSSPIDAAYEMVCWLLEQGLIKNGDNDDSKD